MPILAQLPSATRPGTTYQAWAWGPRLRIDAEAEMIAVEFACYESADAAYGGGEPIGRRTVLKSGKAYRNFVRANLALYNALTSAIDAAAFDHPDFAGATVVAGQPPAWALEPMED